MMAPGEEISHGLLVVMQLVLFALTLALTVVSFRAYLENRSPRLQSAFVAFAFLSMGVALTNLITQLASDALILQVVETVPLIIGFGMFYRALYR